MPMAAAIPFYIATASFVVAAGLSLAYVRGAEERVLFYAKRLAAVGNVGLLAVFLGLPGPAFWGLLALLFGASWPCY